MKTYLEEAWEGLFEDAPSVIVGGVAGCKEDPPGPRFPKKREKEERLTGARNVTNTLNMDNK